MEMIRQVLDKVTIKSFWDRRASTYRNLPFDSIANLEQDPENLKLKVKLETEKVAEYLGELSGKRILDLGAGVGQWSFRFIDAGATSVTAVEYSEPLAEIGRIEARRRRVDNLIFEVSAAEQFQNGEVYDIVFISGLFVYMNDEQAKLLVGNLSEFCHAETIILLRDGTGVPRRHEINNRKSEHLQSLYSALYRTRTEYLELFAGGGFSLFRDENMFDENCPLNKYSETRLRIYRFLRKHQAGMCRN